MSVNLKNQFAFSESKELKQALDIIDEFLGDNMRFQPNKVIFRLYELKWKEMAEDLQSSSLNKTEYSIKHRHILFNQCVSRLIKCMRHGYPELSKTLYRLVEGFNDVIGSQEL